MLKKHDIESRTCEGARIIQAVDDRQPLPPTLRHKLVRISCLALMKKTGSNYPSTDQRHQLSECIVDQLFSYMTSSDRAELKVVIQYMLINFNSNLSLHRMTDSSLVCIMCTKLLLRSLFSYLSSHLPQRTLT